MTPARDHEGVVLNLAVAHMGILVFQNFTKINTFSWAKIRKLSFKRKRFLIKLLPEGYGYYKDTVEFFFEHRNESKNFWKKCIENHAFFRCAEVKKIPRQKPRIFSRGSSFRYSGRTQKQIVEYVRENYVQRRTFQRSVSLRVSGTTDDMQKMGNTASAQPLLPISTSQSYGSVALPPNEECNETKTKPLSHSEPPSPFSLSDGIIGTTNGNMHDKNNEDHIEQENLQHESPELDDDGGGLRSPDYLGQDTDDNISHDSYHLEEKEAVSVEKSPCKTPGSEIYYSEADHQDDSTDNSIHGFISDENSHFITSSFGSFHSESSALTLHYLHSLHGSFKKNLAMNKPFHIAKELLMTERTYKKDLEIVNVWFREDVSREKNLPKDVLELLLSLIDSLYEIHCYLLRHLEEFVLVWEGKGRPTQTTRMTGIGEILEQNIGMIETYNKYINTLPMILEKLHHSYYCNEYFEQMYRCFEMQRICYLPLIAFLLRPVHRLSQYYLLLKKILKHYEQSHPDYGSCKETLLQFKQAINSQDLSIKYLENYANLMELQRDIVGINNLVKPDRFKILKEKKC
ncbi:FERM, ARHGEF and pleckstrin domain-containing protein 2-like [Centruroides sculpturatus]|uniref:FERM, ARHGEF and pleckstrin domain-containing protein 2-like n=1 Tax=Centruroides sculpturatus TaxID=218467 RepID=UPI000C6CD300|nr:FERM, ARHGEF and pleckstrin domain-containing protein 2-like [Centruroides sculpturatus]